VFNVYVLQDSLRRQETQLSQKDKQVEELRSVYQNVSLKLCCVLLLFYESMLFWFVVHRL
jgi:hypothetical protein